VQADPSGHSNILKRLLIHVGASNLGLLMRRLFGFGTPRALQDLATRFQAAAAALPPPSAGVHSDPDRAEHDISAPEGLHLDRRAPSPRRVERPRSSTGC
jgi:hypothetical protein